RNGSGQVAFGNRGGDIRNGADLSGEVVGELIDVVRQISPDSRGTGHTRLAAQFAFNSDFARDSGYLIGESGQRIDHAIDGVGQFGDFAFGLEDELALEIAVGYGSHDLRDAAHLS